MLQRTRQPACQCARPRIPQQKVSGRIPHCRDASNAPRPTQHDRVQAPELAALERERYDRRERYDEAQPRGTCRGAQGDLGRYKCGCAGGESKQ